MSSVSSSILAGVLESLARIEGDGELILKVTFKNGEAVSSSEYFSKQAYLSRLEASPDAPLKAAEEKFVNAHHTIQSRKKHIVDPLGILNGSYKPPKEAARRTTARASKAKKPGR